MHAAYPPSQRLETLGLTDEGPFLEPEMPSTRRTPWHLIALLLLTIVGGVLRFLWLDQPAIWGDEAATFRRVCGTFEEMLQTLERDPFGPLFYEFQWWLRQRVQLEPFWLRFLPAVAGTAMIPAMYFLARQVSSIRTSLVTAMFTTCSAWMINYSRDAKMYMTFWLFCALTAGCFLWWLRTRTWTAWLSWIAASCAMIGLNLWGAVVLAMLPLWLLTAKRVHWAMGVGFVVGLLIISVGPIGYYTQFNTWRDKAKDTGRFVDINWVEDRNRGQSAIDLAKDSAAAFLYCFNFVAEGSRNERPDPPPQVYAVSTVVITSIVVLLLLGAMPWRRPTDPLPVSSPTSWWRPTLWLSVWLIVPTYVFYCISVDQFQSPADWWANLQGYLHHRPAVFAVQIAVAAVLVATAWWAGLVLGVIALLLAFVPLGVALLTVYWPDAGDNEVLRPVEIITRWLNTIADPRLFWPLLVIVPGIAIARSGATYSRRVLHVLTALAILAGLWFLLDLVYDQCRTAIDRMEAAGVKPTSIWMPRYLGFIWPPLAIVVAALLVRLPTRPLRWTAIAALLAANLFVAHRRVLGHTEPPIGLVARDVKDSTLSRESPVRVFAPHFQIRGGPSAGSLYNMIGRYYLLHDHVPGPGDRPLSPYSLLSDRFPLLSRARPTSSPELIANTANNAKQVNRIIVWKPDRDPYQDRVAPPDALADDILPALGADWTLNSEHLYPVRYHWTWAERYVYIRREYVRKSPALPPAATQPAP